MEKINIAELLRDCPNGMELDCVLWDNVTFDRVVDGGIWIKHTDSKSSERSLYLYNDGNFPIPNFGSFRTKCVIFPKGKKTWEGFHRPFVEGDVVSTESGMYIGIVKSTKDNHQCCTFCSIHGKKDFHMGKELFFSRLATKEEKQIMFDIIKANGYHWNPETKTLEKLPEFKDGDIIFAQYYDLKYASIVKQIDRSSNIHVYCLYGFTDSVFATDEILGRLEERLEIRFATEEEKEKLLNAIKENGYKWNLETKTLEKLIEPVFKAGDRIRSKKDAPINISGILITKVNECGYGGVIGDTTNTVYISFKYQDKYELVPNKFDINTLVSFESRVLMRSSNAREWTGTIFSHYSNNKFYGCGMCCDQCIPYEGNEHLLGKTDDCKEYYKTWK